MVLGATKLWGLPHVPLDFIWPINDGMTLGFLGQVNLSELAHCYNLGLPTEGLLSFWFHEGLNDDRACGRVFHFSGQELKILEYPDENEQNNISYLVNFCEPEWKVTLMASPSLPCAYFDSVYIPILGLSETEIDLYQSFQSMMDDFLDLPRSDYQIGGYPHRCQLDPQRAVYFISHDIEESEIDEDNLEVEGAMLKFVRKFRLLAQFDGDNKDINDSSEGSIYFFYPEETLDQNRFENPYTLFDFES